MKVGLVGDTNNTVTVMAGQGYLCVGGLKGGRERVSVLWELAESGGKVW